MRHIHMENVHLLKRAHVCCHKTDPHNRIVRIISSVHLFGRRFFAASLVFAIGRRRFNCLRGCDFPGRYSSIDDRARAIYRTK